MTTITTQIKEIKTVTDDRNYNELSGEKSRKVAEKYWRRCKIVKLRNFKCNLSKK